jgi:hypothetical protein
MGQRFVHWHDFVCLDGLYRLPQDNADDPALVTCPGCQAHQAHLARQVERALEGDAALRARIREIKTLAGRSSKW